MISLIWAYVKIEETVSGIVQGEEIIILVLDILSLK